MAHEQLISVPVEHWDQTVSYAQAAQRQEDAVLAGREMIAFCEHPATITLGTASTPSDLTLSEQDYTQRGITILKTPRGGMATYHGPGQLVMYPIIDLRGRDFTVHGFLRLLEEVMIEAVEEFGIEAHRIEGKTGIWIGERKLGFIGVRVRRGFSYHGISLNVTPQQEAFQAIVPCGMPGLHVTSIAEEATEPVPDLWRIAAIMEEIMMTHLARHPKVKG